MPRDLGEGADVLGNLMLTSPPKSGGVQARICGGTWYGAVHEGKVQQCRTQLLPNGRRISH